MTEAASPIAVALPDWPVFGFSDDVRPALAQTRAASSPCVLATLALVEGGGPRPPGAQMLFAGDELWGFLSGGCIEGDLAAHARAVVADHQPRWLVYGEGGPFADIRLVCGGRVEILLERLAPDDPAVETLLQLGAARRPALWVSDGRARACWPTDQTPPPLSAPLSALAARLIAQPLTRAIADTAEKAAALRLAPVRRMIVVGGDPTAMAIAGLAAQTGFETWLVRPKGPEAPPPLPGVRYDRGATDLALARIGLDAWTYVAVATHDLEADEAALAIALPSPAAYVGALGARRRLPERQARLRRLGLSETAIARLKAPIGLDLGGKAPFEIAVAVLAEAIGYSL
jgi:xanthine dehydrogenase accessory factor